LKNSALKCRNCVSVMYSYIVNHAYAHKCIYHEVDCKSILVLMQIRSVDATASKWREASLKEQTASGARASPIGRSHQEKSSLTPKRRERPPRLWR
jgi:hypothetical protein